LRQRKETKQSGQVLRAIGEMIADTRGELGVTQTELARRVHVSRFQMCKHESGLAEMPVTRLFEICSALKVKPTDFMRSVVKTMTNGS
jgi:DNA-binding XRE family transcriptional regulator